MEWIGNRSEPGVRGTPEKFLRKIATIAKQRNIATDAQWNAKLIGPLAGRVPDSDIIEILRHALADTIEILPANRDV